MKATVTFIGMQETATPDVVIPLFNTAEGDTFTLGTCLDRFGDFEIVNHREFCAELAKLPSAVFNSVLVHTRCALPCPD